MNNVRPEFVETRWSLVAGAGTSDDVRRRAALDDLFSLYWYPLYAFLRRRGRSDSDAADLVQSLFTRLVAADSIAGVAPEGGRFRSWLLKSLSNLARDDARGQRALKRGEVAPLALDQEVGEARFQAEAAAEVDPAALFERAWAREVLQAALHELRREEIARGRGDAFEVLRGALSGEWSPARAKDCRRRAESDSGRLARRDSPFPRSLSCCHLEDRARHPGRSERDRR